MAPANGVNLNGQNGDKRRPPTITPALPLLLRQEKAHQIGKIEETSKNGPAQATSQQTKSDSQNPDAIAISIRTGDDVKTLSRHFNGDNLTTASSVSAQDESFSVHSSQDPASITDVDSSATSAVTNNSGESTFPTSFGPSSPDSKTIPDQPQSVVQHPPTTLDSIHHGSENLLISKTTQHDELARTDRGAPDAPIGVVEVSPLTNHFPGSSAVELSTHTTPTVSKSDGPLVSPASNEPTTFPKAVRPHAHAYPEAITNGSRQSHFVANTSNGHRSSGSQITSPPSILDHLLHLANSKHMADFVIQVEQPHPNLQPFITYSHGLILLRSERTRDLMTRPQNVAFSLPVIHITPPRSIQPHAFEAALRFLYSDTILSPEALYPRDTYMDRHARAHVVDYVLSYWTAGVELGLEPVSARAFSLLSGMIDWDVAELLVREALALRAVVPPISRFSSISEPSVMADSIITLIIGLFMHRLDVNQFRLDLGDQPLTMPSRLTHLEHVRTTSHPALAGMVFGSMPASEGNPAASQFDSTPSSADVVASNIFLNLDFPDLNNLARDLIRLHGSIGVKIISEVINEREKRRLQIFNNGAYLNKDRTTNSAAWDVIGWQEIFEDGKLYRERVGFTLPGKKNKPIPQQD